ncbi:hypothetical protein INR49_000590, partial [Caranx melampygus]
MILKLNISLICAQSLRPDLCSRQLKRIVDIASLPVSDVDITLLTSVNCKLALAPPSPLVLAPGQTLMPAHCLPTCSWMITAFTAAYGVGDKGTQSQN